MQFLPVIQRELLVAARKRGTYLARTLSAGVLLALFAALLHVNRATPAFGGAQILQWLSIIVFFECMLAGMRYTSDCLSEEKREGTLGLLFLTNLSGLDVVLGKMIARSLGAIFNLVAVIPILALTLLVGGISGAQIMSLSLALFVATIFSLCAGAFISSRGFRERGVLTGTLALLLMACFLPILAADFGIWLMNRFSLGIDYELVQAIRFFSPLHAFRGAGRGFGPGFQSACWTLLAVSAAFIGYASWRIRHGFGEPGPPEAKAVRKRRGPARGSLRLSCSVQNPILWLAMRVRTRDLRVFAFCLAALVFGLIARIAFEQRWAMGPPLVVLGSYGAHALYKFLITAETVRQLNEDQRSGALELLLSTPIRARDIVRGQITATRKTWGAAAVCVGLMNITWMTEDMFMRDIGILLPCSLVLLAFDSYTLAWRSVLNALRGERYTVTVFRTFSRVMLPPIAVIALVLASLMGSSASSDTIETIFVMWTAGCIVYDLTLMADARAHLRKLRAIAAGDERVARATFRDALVSIVPDGQIATSH